MAHSTTKRNRTKPEKPREDYPLFAHATGRWAKKVRGKTHYFGPWEDPDGALRNWLDDKDDILAGRIPRRKRDADALTLENLVNKYLATKKGEVESGEIAERTFWGNFSSCEAIVKHFGKDRRVDDIRPEDFEKYKRNLVSAGYAPNSVNLEVTRCRALFSYGFDAGLYEKPVRFGPGFRTIGRKAARRLNGKRPEKMYEAAEIRQLLDAATVPMRAMIFMAINGGFGNHDLANLPKSALDLKNGWVDFARLKTGVDRRVPLWPETIEALREATQTRPEPTSPADDDLVFLTHRGLRWVRLVPHKTEGKPPRWHDAITLECGVLLKDQGLKKPGRCFYALRHTHRTVADEALDQVAAGHIMGHIDTSMAGVYRQRISDERLRVVTEHVHAWLYGDKEGGEK